MAGAFETCADLELLLAEDTEWRKAAKEAVRGARKGDRVTVAEDDEVVVLEAANAKGADAIVALHVGSALKLAQQILEAARRIQVRLELRERRVM